MFLTAALRRSWNNRPGTPARLQADRRETRVADGLSALSRKHEIVAACLNGFTAFDDVNRYRNQLPERPVRRLPFR